MGDVALQAAMGERLAAIREGQGLEQKDLAATLGISPSGLCRIEKGQRSLDSIFLYRVAEALGAPLSAFFPPAAGDDELMLARQGTADEESMKAMTDWSIKVLEDLDFVCSERLQR